jgi:alpha-N-arabinofuranosidase
MRILPGLLFLLAPLAAQTARIEIDATQVAAYRIPRTIYGTFLEPILQSIYGGLWAQVVTNPSFEENLWSLAELRRMAEREPALIRASELGLPAPWEPLDQAQGSRYEPRWGDAANASRSLLVMALPGGETGVRQALYLPVHRVPRYQGSLYAKHLDGPARITVSLRRRNKAEETFASSSVGLQGGEWRRYEFALEIPPGKLARLEPCDLVIAMTGETRVLLDQAFLFPADHVERMDPEMIELARALNTPLIRFGGNYTSGYHWRDGIGPMDQRVPMLNLAWGMPEYNHFGTDEFLAFCRLAGSAPQIALNLGSGTPEEAAAWVRYVNGKLGSGQLWELGNELWGNFQIGYPALERAAARTRAFAEAVRAVEPKARLIATGQDPDRFEEWNAQLLALPPGTFEYLATHFVAGCGQVRRRNATPDFIAESALALPVGLERQLRRMKEQIDASPHKGQVRIAFTEWLFHGPNDGVPRFANMGGAVLAAGFLNALIRTADFVPIANMTGLVDFAGITKKRSQVFAPPAYWALRMYSNSSAARPVAVSAGGGTYDVKEGNNRLPEIPAVPYLDVVAGLDGDGGALTVFAVNRHQYRDIETVVRIAGFQPARRARVQTLSGTSLYQVNDELRPNAVRPVESVINTAASEFEYLFPRASVTVIELRRAGAN